jgi:hypothetical protein
MDQRIGIVKHIFPSVYRNGSDDGRPPCSCTLQQGFDRLALLCLGHQQSAPLHVPELLALCEKHFADWPLLQLPSNVHPQDSLLCNQLPTYFCEEYARSGSDPAADLFEERFIEQLRSACVDKPELYASARELLINRLVLAEQEFMGESIPVGARSKTFSY